MPEAKKISELPVLSSVQPNDILPIVDEALTQTSKCTASQIAALGGGPPGVNTVEAIHIRDGSVTAAKTYFSAPDRIATRTAAGAGAGVEVPCTPYARGLLAAVDGPAARAYLDALQSMHNAAFTGQTRFPDGSETAPSITNTGNLDTGIFFPFTDSIGFANGGLEIARISPDGFRIAGSGYSSLLPSAGARAWCVIGTAAGTVLTFRNSHEVANRAGLWPGTMAWDQATRDRMVAIEAARGFAISGMVNAQLSDGRTNYTTPGDNTHYTWNGSDFVATAASGVGWIGSYTVTGSGDQRLIRGQNVASVLSFPFGWQIYFWQPMPTTDYAVLATTDGGGSTHGNRTFANSAYKTLTSVNIYVTDAAGNQAGAAGTSVAIAIIV